MKKKLFSMITVALCAVFLFAGCAPATADENESPSQDQDLILAITGSVTQISTADGTTQISVDAAAMERESRYQLLILTMSSETPVTFENNTKDYEDGLISVGDVLEVNLKDTTPVTASEPPMTTPVSVKIVHSADAENWK